MDVDDRKPQDRAVGRAVLIDVEPHQLPCVRPVAERDVIFRLDVGIVWIGGAVEALRSEQESTAVAVLRISSSLDISTTVHALLFSVMVNPERRLSFPASHHLAGRRR